MFHSFSLRGGSEGYGGIVIPLEHVRWKCLSNKVVVV